MKSYSPLADMHRAVPSPPARGRISYKTSPAAISHLQSHTRRRRGTSIINVTYSCTSPSPCTGTAEEVRDQLVKTVSTLPEHLRGSLTWDQGCEMAGHKSFSITTGCPVFFCDPASPWQRGSNENTNGLLRQYFPKGTDLSVFGPEDLEHVAQELNGRPRKTLNFDTPAERMRDLIASV